MEENKVEFSYTESQKKVILMSSMIIEGAIKSGKNFTIKIVGSAGTGKTTIVSGILEEIYKKRRDFSTSVVAPTHKALSVIKDKLYDTSPDSPYYGRCSYSTLASLLKLERTYNYQTQESEFKMGRKTEEYALRGEKLIIIDEASMVTRDQYDMLLKLAERYGIIIIFLGDIKQLPPVKEKSSQAVIEEVSGNIFTFNLFEIIRQGKDNPILDIAHNLDLVKNFQTKLVNEQGYLYTTDINSVVKNLSAAGGSDVMKYLSWSNTDVDKMNLSARNHSYGVNPEEFYVGETIISQSNSNNANNNEEILVEEIHRIDQATEICDLTELNKLEDKYKSKVKFLSDDTHLDEERGVVCHKGKIYFVAEITVINDSYLVISQDQQKSYKYALQILKQLVKLGLIHWKRTANFEETFLKYKYAYAMTVHKSQGSTFKNVIINLRDLERNTKEFNEILYTAITRASKKVIFYYPLKKNKEEDE